MTVRYEGEVGVVLAAHGAGDDSVANLAVHRIAERLAEITGGVHVKAAFNRGQPSFTKTAAEVDEHTLVIPLLTSDGYFACRIAKTFGKAGARVTPPIGLLPALREGLIQNVAETCSIVDSAMVLVVGHGTRKHHASDASTEALAAEIRNAVARPVRTAYLDQSPKLADVARSLSRETLVVLPFLIGGGEHERFDIPRILDEHHAGVDYILPGLLAEPRLVTMLQDMLETVVKRLPLRMNLSNPPPPLVGRVRDRQCDSSPSRPVQMQQILVLHSGF